MSRAWRAPARGERDDLLVEIARDLLRALNLGVDLLLEACRHCRWRRACRNRARADAVLDGLAHEVGDIRQARLVSACAALALQELLGIEAPGIEHGAAGLEAERRHLRALVEVGQLLAADLELARGLQEADLGLEPKRGLLEDRFARRHPSLGKVIAEVEKRDEDKGGRDGADGEQVAHHAPAFRLRAPLSLAG